MKKSQLKNIIRESIKELINEQANSSNITVSPGDVVAVAAAYPIITNPQDLTIGPYGMNESPFSHVFGGDSFFNGVFIPSGPSNYQMSSNCGAAKSYEIEDQAQADAFNSIMNGENGVYLELASTSNPNIANAAYQATENVMAQLNANFQGEVNLKTYSPECAYVGPGAGLGTKPDPDPDPDPEPGTLYYSFNDFPTAEEAQNQSDAGNTLIFRFDFCPALGTDQSMINSPDLDASGCITLNTGISVFNYSMVLNGVQNPQPGMFNYGDGSCQTACAAANDDSGDSGADQKDPVGTTPISITDPAISSAPKKTPSKGDMQKGRMQKLANIKPRRK